jgi:hypothetical protein
VPGKRSRKTLLVIINDISFRATQANALMRAGFGVELAERIRRDPARGLSASTSALN